MDHLLSRETGSTSMMLVSSGWTVNMSFSVLDRHRNEEPDAARPIRGCGDTKGAASLH
jgi:hypothetical protein